VRETCVSHINVFRPIKNEPIHCASSVTCIEDTGIYYDAFSLFLTNNSKPPEAASTKRFMCLCMVSFDL
jgi:hypothetical protein